MMSRDSRAKPGGNESGLKIPSSSCSHPFPFILPLSQTCLPPSTLQRARDTGNNSGHPLDAPLCPTCHAPLSRLRILPLRTSTLEEAARDRDREGPAAEESNSTSLSSSSSGPGRRMGSLVSPTGRHSPGGGLGPNTSQLGAGSSRTYRTGRWSAEESGFVDRLIAWFESGRLPLPNGVRLNEFLCDMLACRTSRLTKKLKNARLSARTYRVRRAGGDQFAGLGGTWGPDAAAAAQQGQQGGGGSAEREVGRDVQHAQGLFIKSANGPEWVRSELQFNVSRLWRTHLANFW